MNISERKPRILIVDDVPKNIQVAAGILQDEGYQPAFAQSGKAALEQVRATPFDLILLDVMMPEMDGFEVCRQLQQDPATRDIPVIFLTAKTDSDSTVTGLQAGAVDYVCKPFNSAELLARVRTHLELKQTREQLHEMNAAKDKFFSIIAHDLLNPVSSLNNLTDLLLNKFDTADDERKREWVRMQLDATERIVALLENLLQWGRSQTGRLKVTLEEIDVNTLLQSAASLGRIPAGTKNIALTAAETGGLRVRADRNMVDTVLHNIIVNAIKFTPEGGRVQVAARTKGTDVELSVEDSGVGIPEDACEKLFRIDMQHTTEGTAGEKGSGLGLILCKEFIEKTGGSIRVTSTPGQGSTFYITLPRA